MNPTNGGTRSTRSVALASLAAITLLVAACSASAAPAAGVAGATGTPAAASAPAVSGGPAGSRPASYGGGYGSQAGSAGTPTAPAATPEPSASSGTAYEVTISSDSKLGSFLAGEDGKALYVFLPDRQNQSSCSGQCAAAWPPFTLDTNETVKAGNGVRGSLTTFTRPDGSRQVSYDGIPLYYFAGDTKAGDVNGQGIDRKWWLAVPDPKAPVAAIQINVAADAKLGSYLVGAGGLTLYRFKPDKPGQSTCVDKCAAAWPPVIVSAVDRVSAGAGATGTLGTFKRPDGSLQVSYNGMPLYYFAGDLMAGDVTGQGVNNVWFVVAP